MTPMYETNVRYDLINEDYSSSYTFMGLYDYLDSNASTHALA